MSGLVPGAGYHVAAVLWPEVAGNTLTCEMPAHPRLTTRPARPDIPAMADSKGKSKGKRVKRMVSPLNGAVVENPGGPRPGSGRKPEKWRQWVAHLVNSPECREQVRQVLHDKDHPAFHKVLSALAPHGYGTPNQPFQDGTEEPKPLQVEFREAKKG